MTHAHEAPAQGPAPESLLAASGLSCLRGDRQLFRDLSLRVDAGQALQVRGPNGCGKTTLLRILCGLTLPEDGTIRWRYDSTRPMLAAVTTTAGGLVLTGELTGDFLVLDAGSGEELYRFHTGGPIGGGVVTYSVNGRQYVAVSSGDPSILDWRLDHTGSPTVLIFALPE